MIDFFYPLLICIWSMRLSFFDRLPRFKLDLPEYALVWIEYTWMSIHAYLLSHTKFHMWYALFCLGTRSIVYVVFAFRRHVGYFLLQLYIPCILIVFLSWVGLWLNREATNDRINLGVTTVLTLIFVIIEGKKDLPKVSYVTALDLFLAVCFIFVFSTLFEFALVHYYTKARTGDLNENMRDLEDYVIRVIEIEKFCFFVRIILWFLFFRTIKPIQMSMTN